METTKNTGKQIAGLLIGAALGTALGVLFAPNKGTKTRSRLLTRAKLVTRNVKSKLAKDSDLIREDAEKIKDMIIEDVDKMTDNKKKK